VLYTNVDARYDKLATVVGRTRIAKLNEARIQVAAGVHIGATWQIRWIDLHGSDDAVCRSRYCSNLPQFASKRNSVFLLLQQRHARRLKVDA